MYKKSLEVIIIIINKKNIQWSHMGKEQRKEQQKAKARPKIKLKKRKEKKVLKEPPTFVVSLLYDSFS